MQWHEVILVLVDNLIKIEEQVKILDHFWIIIASYNNIFSRGVGNILICDIDTDVLIEYINDCLKEYIVLDYENAKNLYKLLIVNPITVIADIYNKVSTNEIMRASNGKNGAKGARSKDSENSLDVNIQNMSSGYMFDKDVLLSLILQEVYKIPNREGALIFIDKIKRLIYH